MSSTGIYHMSSLTSSEIQLSVYIHVHYSLTRRHVFKQSEAPGQHYLTNAEFHVEMRLLQFVYFAMR